MINRILTAVVLMLGLFSTQSTVAQQYRWVKGGGSNCNMTPSRNEESVKYMCTDANRNVYALAVVGDRNVTVDTFFRIQGGFGSFCDANIMLASYNCNGQLRWAKLIDSYGDATGFDVVYDGVGNVYMVGRTTPGDKKYYGDTTVNSINYNSFIIKYDTSGKMKWLRFLGADVTSNQFQIIRGGSVAIDAAGAPHFFASVNTGLQLTSSMTAQAGTYDIAYSTSGTQMSATRLPIDSTWAISKAIFNKKSGAVYAKMSRTTNASTPFENHAISCFKNNIHIWTDSSGVIYTAYGNIDYDGNNSIYTVVGGQINSFHLGGLTGNNTTYPGGNAYAAIARIDTNGVGKWAYKLDNTTGGVGFRQVTILPNGNVASNGTFIDHIKNGNDSMVTLTAEGNNPFLIIVDSSGSLIKLDQQHGSGFYDQGDAITSDNAGSIYLGGKIETNLTASGLGTGYTSSTGNTDFYVIKYGYACNCTSPTANYTNGTASGKTVQFTYSGTATGIDSLVWVWGDGQKQKVVSGYTTPISHTFASNGKYNVCVTAYSQCGSNSYCKQTPLSVSSFASLGDVKVYPNPMHEYFIIEGAQNASAVLTNTIGQIALRFTVNTSKQVMDISSLPSGSYILQLTDANGNRGATSIVKQ